MHRVLTTAIAALTLALFFAAGSAWAQDRSTMHDRPETVKVGYWALDETDCEVCKVVEIVVLPSERIGLSIAGHLQPIIVSLWHALFAAWLVASVMVMCFGKANLPKLGLMFLVGLLISTILETMGVRTAAEGQTGSLVETGNLWFDFIYIPIRDFSVGLSIELVSWTVGIAADISGVDLPGDRLPMPPNAQSMTPMAQLFAVIEVGIFNIITAGFAAITGSWAQAVVQFLQALILAIPFMFVAMIFAAFILESNFKFLAMTALSPFFVAAAFFPGMPRSWCVAAIRIYMSAGFTMIFASMAMAFTIAVTEKYRAHFICHAAKDETACSVAGTTVAAMQAAQEANAVNLEGLLGSWAFWVILFLGMVSVLLHLKAPTLASNISGANDSAAPAAAVVAGGKLLAGGALMSGLKVAGVPMLSNAINQNAQRGGVGGSLARGAWRSADLGARFGGARGPSDYVQALRSKVAGSLYLRR